MKKNLILLMAIFYGCNMYSQNKGTFMLSVNGSYLKNSSGNGTTINQYGTSGKYLKTGFSAGGFLSSHFEIGLGLDYYWSSEARESEMLIAEQIIQIDIMKIKSNAFIPNAYATYYAKILNRLYFAAKLGTGIGQIKSTEEGNRMSFIRSDGPIVVQPSSISVFSYDDSYKYTYFSAGIYPQINYYLTNTIGFSLSLGLVEYSILDWEKDNSTWLASFDPSYWSFGFKFKFDSGKEAQ